MGEPPDTQAATACCARCAAIRHAGDAERLQETFYEIIPYFFDCMHARGARFGVTRRHRLHLARRLRFQQQQQHRLDQQHRRLLTARASRSPREVRSGSDFMAPAVAPLCARTDGDTAWADDLVQDTAERALARWAAFRPDRKSTRLNSSH